jgi:heterogeneous nuclear rnp K-like protein 2
MLKRKNEESEECKDDTHFPKRVALDAEAVELKDIEHDKTKTAVSLNAADSELQEQQEKEQEADEVMGGQSDDASPEGASDNTIADANAHDSTNDTEKTASNSAESSLPVMIAQPESNITNTSTLATTTPSSVPTKGDYAAPTADNGNGNGNAINGPISSHKVRDEDPSYVHFRMLVTIPDTAAIVGKGGDSISKIKEQSNARVNVSENLKGVPERVISVRGSAEYVAKAFGLIIRTINNEPFDVSSNVESKSYNLRLLFPHTIMGYIIGKKGSRFREIEENSAAALKANDQILPSSTDRILNITGVADAIHIATYYVAQTVIEHKQQLQKAVYYNPANFNQPTVPALSMSHANNNNGNNNKFGSFSGSPNNMMMPNMYGANNMKMMNPNPQQMPFNGMMGNGMNMNMNMNMAGTPGMGMNMGGAGGNGGVGPGMGMNMNMGGGGVGVGQGMGMMGGPSPMSAPVVLISPNASSNSRNGEVITGPDGKVNQEIFVSQNHIGLVIGRGGKNLKDIRQNTGCYVKVNDEVPGSDERKLTLIGNVYGIQNAIVLINNKIENEKMRKHRDGNH